MYIDKDTLEYPLTEREIRKRSPHVSYPKLFKSSRYLPVFPAPQPSVSILEVSLETDPELTDKEHWEQRFVVKDKYKDYEDEEGLLVTKEEQEVKVLAEESEKAQKDYLKNCENAVDNLIDAKVKSLGYDNVNATAKYLRPNSPFYAECVAIGSWVDACWMKCHELLSLGVLLEIEALLVEMPVYGGV